ncbi:MAG TPA: helix-turn-helix transcriptional regulator [Syntrophales bacterium]|nr:helix-turn-helix transcriptional regulator [Syntrophales bacterium]HRR41236.1 helix-turn-helix transcriptional regulator [Syntrophales bacterium]
MKLDEARFRKRMTQADLFLLTGISTSKISLIENGYLVPGEKDREALASALGVSAAELEFEKKSPVKANGGTQ